MFENYSIGIVAYLLIVGGSLLFLIFFGLYLASIYHFGKPLKAFLDTRIKRWNDPKVALFEIINIMGNVRLVQAREETGGYRQPECTRKVREPPTKDQKIRYGLLTALFILLHFAGLHWLIGTGILTAAGTSMVWFILPVLAIARQPVHTELIGDNRPQPLIMPKSIYSVNEVPTIPLLDIHPPLHPELKACLQFLIDSDINNPEDLKKKIDDKHAEDPLIPGYTYQQFYNLYLSTRQKYEFKVTVSDITEVMNKSYDKNYSESIMAKEYNAKSKKKIDNTTLKYGYAALIIVALGVTFKLIYFTLYR